MAVPVLITVVMDVVGSLMVLGYKECVCHHDRRVSAGGHCM
jgi:hypothetical protein